MTDEYKRLLFDRRIREGLGQAALFYKLKGEDEKAQEYVEVWKKIQKLIYREKGS